MSSRSYYIRFTLKCILLIDRIVFYAVSAIFHPYNDGKCILKLTNNYDKKNCFCMANFNDFRGNCVFANSF